VEDNAYARAVGARWLISAVARIYQPGAKADCCLILEGPQGIRKSTALRTLAGEYFTDELADLNSKDAALQTRGVWIIELSELDTLARSEIAVIKAFMSRTSDRFRPPYGKRLIESPRQCVFAGTVNHHDYLKDDSGGRRFWPVQCGRIDVGQLERDRDQLWAEARAKYIGGALWWLETAELVEAAEQEQTERYEEDPWTEVIAEWAEVRETVALSEILENCLAKPRGAMDAGGQEPGRTLFAEAEVGALPRSAGAATGVAVSQGEPMTCSQCSQSVPSRVPSSKLQKRNDVPSVPGLSASQKILREFTQGFSEPTGNSGNTGNRPSNESVTVFPVGFQYWEQLGTLVACALACAVF